MTAEEFSGLQGAGARALQAHRRWLTGAHSSVQFPQ
jgi:hypothetical protein